MIEIRNLITTRETIFSELGVAAPRPVARAVGMVVILNPCAGRFVDDLRPVFEAGAMLGERLMPELVKLLDGPAVSRVQSSASTARWSTAALACTRCLAGRCAGGDWRRQGGDLAEREGRRGRREP
jgi:Amino acid synthesis